VIVPEKTNVCGQVVLEGGATEAVTLVTVKGGGMVVMLGEGDGVKVAVITIGVGEVVGLAVVGGADWTKPKLNPVMVPQPKILTAILVGAVGYQPAGVLATTRYCPNGTSLKR
jgi:hypothetical protein